MTSLVWVSTPLPGVTMLTLGRPDALNALNVDLVNDLHKELDRLAADRCVRVVIITGAGRAFCAGLDLDGYGDPGRIEEMGFTLGTLNRQREIARLVEKIHTLPQPVIAAVNGPAAGGGFALVLASDIRIAAESSVYAVAFNRAGFSACDIGTSWLLPRIVGAGNAHDLMLTGRKMYANEARSMGLVAAVVPGDQLMDVALAKAAEIMKTPPASAALTKQGMWLALEMPSLRAGIELENRQQVITALTEDQPEAVAALLEKRKPNYKHR